MRGSKESMRCLPGLEVGWDDQTSLLEYAAACASLSCAFHGACGMLPLGLWTIAVGKIAHIRNMNSMFTACVARHRDPWSASLLSALHTHCSSTFADVASVVIDKSIHLLRAAVPQPGILCAYRDTRSCHRRTNAAEMWHVTQRGEQWPWSLSCSCRRRRSLLDQDALILCYLPVQ